MNDTKKMLTRDPLLQALLNVECSEATHCVDACDVDGDDYRFWAMSQAHAEEIAAALPKFGLELVEIQDTES
jgi:hypothetical protein